MKAAKQKKLKANGWKMGGAADFLELSEEEATYITLKLKLAKSLKEVRTRRRLTQKEFAKRMVLLTQILLEESKSFKKELFYGQTRWPC